MRDAERMENTTEFPIDSFKMKSSVALFANETVVPATFLYFVSNKNKLRTDLDTSANFQHHISHIEQVPSTLEVLICRLKLPLAVH